MEKIVASAVIKLITDRMSQLVLARRPEVGERGVRRAIADACGVSQPAVSQWFSGETGNIKNESLISMALAFDTTLDWLLTGEGEPPRRDGDSEKLKGPRASDHAVVPDSLGDRLAYFRRLAGLSQRALAAACGWESQSRVGNYEAGTREPTLADIEVLARALGISAVVLAYGEIGQVAASHTKADSSLDQCRLLPSNLMDIRVVQRAKVVLAFNTIFQALDADVLSPSTLEVLEGVASSVALGMNIATVRKV
jgi:transcriptional regulator with XRE-family HTH domain